MKSKIPDSYFINKAIESARKQCDLSNTQNPDIDDNELFGDDVCERVRRNLQVNDYLLWDDFIFAPLNTGCVKFWLSDAISCYLSGNKSLAEKDSLRNVAITYLCGVLCDVCRSRQDLLGYKEYSSRNFPLERDQYIKAADRLLEKHENKYGVQR